MRGELLRIKVLSSVMRKLRWRLVKIALGIFFFGDVGDVGDERLGLDGKE